MKEPSQRIRNGFSSHKKNTPQRNEYCSSKNWEQKVLPQEKYLDYQWYHQQKSENRMHWPGICLSWMHHEFCFKPDKTSWTSVKVNLNVRMTTLQKTLAKRHTEKGNLTNRMNQTVWRKLYTSIMDLQHQFRGHAQTIMVWRMCAAHMLHTLIWPEIN